MAELLTGIEPYEVLYQGRDRKKFLAARQSGIGASDIAAVLGFSKWNTPHDVWEKKTGRAPDKDQTQAMEWGIALEDVVARRFQVLHGRLNADKPIGRVRPTPGVLQSRKWPWLLASIDRIVEVFETNVPSPLEIKTANAFSRSDWSEKVPDYYASQSQAQQLVWWGEDALGTADPAMRGYVVPLIGGNDMPEPFILPFDQEFAQFLIDDVGEWWEKYVLADVPPPLTLQDDVNRIFPAMRGKALVADEELLGLVAERNNLSPKKSELEKLDNEIKARIKLAMLDATVLTSAVDESGAPVDILVKWDMPKTPPAAETVFDEEAFRAAHPELWSEFAVTRLKKQSRTMTFPK